MHLLHETNTRAIHSYITRRAHTSFASRSTEAARTHALIAGAAGLARAAVHARVALTCILCFAASARVSRRTHASEAVALADTRRLIHAGLRSARVTCAMKGKRGRHAENGEITHDLHIAGR